MREALIVVWEVSDRVCGKRLRPLAPLLIAAMEPHSHLQQAPEVRGGLLSMSAATTRLGPFPTVTLVANSELSICSGASRSVQPVSAEKFGLARGAKGGLSAGLANSAPVSLLGTGRLGASSARGMTATTISRVAAAAADGAAPCSAIYTRWRVAGWAIQSPRRSRRSRWSAPPSRRSVWCSAATRRAARAMHGSLSTKSLAGGRDPLNRVF